MCSKLLNYLLYSNVWVNLWKLDTNCFFLRAVYDGSYPNLLLMASREVKSGIVSRQSQSVKDGRVDKENPLDIPSRSGDLEERKRPNSNML